MVVPDHSLKTRLLSELQHALLSCTPIIHFFVRSRTCCAVSRKSLPAPGPDRLQRGLLNFSYPKQIHEATERRFITCHISEPQHCFLLIPFPNVFIVRLKKKKKKKSGVNHPIQSVITGWNSNQFSNVLSPPGVPQGPWGPPPPLWGCAGVCAAMCLMQHDFSDTNICTAWWKVLLFVLFSSFTQKQLQRNCLYPLSAACTQTETDLSRESLLNHRTTHKTVSWEVSPSYDVPGMILHRNLSTKCEQLFIYIYIYIYIELQRSPKQLKQMGNCLKMGEKTLKYPVWFYSVGNLKEQFTQKVQS